MKAVADEVCETDVEAPAKKWAADRGWWVRKFISTRRGVPDNVFAFSGQIIWIEFKRPGVEATDQQKLEHGRMRAQGLKVYVVDNLKRFKEIIREHEAVALGLA